MFRWLWSFLFPVQCCQCQKLGRYLCQPCTDEVSFWQGPITLEVEQNCFDTLQVACLFEPPITTLMHCYKYQYIIGLRKWFAKLLFLSLVFPPITVVTSVPSHPRKQSIRGFNPAEEIAKELASLLQVPYLPLLKKNHHTKSQAGISNRSKRLESQSNLYSLLLSNTISQQHILVVDDVITTGATLTTIGKLLRSAQPASLHAVAVAHGG